MKKDKRGIFPKNRKGLSAVVITIILIALSMAAVIVVWVFVNNMIKKQIGSSESCFGNFDKVTINRQYTCYDSVNDVVRFSLMIGDIDVDSVVIAVSSASSVKSYELTNTAQTISGLTKFSGTSPTSVILPGKNAGLTYNATGFTSTADQIHISPVIGGTQCEVSDSLSEVESCTI